MSTPLYGPLPSTEAGTIYKPVGKTVDFERFCERHPYRVVGPENMPERRFSTLACAARTAVSAGPRFHVECDAFRSSYDQCRTLVIDADYDRKIVASQEKMQQIGWQETK
jgi:hypothetical protein